MCSYRDFGKKVGHYWYINDKTSRSTPINLTPSCLYRQCPHQWCEQADNLPWSYFLKPKFWRCSEVYKKAVIAP